MKVKCKESGGVGGMSRGLCGAGVSRELMWIMSEGR